MRALVTHRPHVVPEGPAPDVLTLATAHFVGEAEVNTLIDARIDHVLHHIRKPRVVAWIDGQGGGAAAHRKCEFVSVEGLL